MHFRTRYFAVPIFQCFSGKRGHERFRPQKTDQGPGGSNCGRMFAQRHWDDMLENCLFPRF